MSDTGDGEARVLLPQWDCCGTHTHILCRKLGGQEGRTCGACEKERETKAGALEVPHGDYCLGRIWNRCSGSSEGEEKSCV